MAMGLKEIAEAIGSLEDVLMSYQKEASLMITGVHRCTEAVKENTETMKKLIEVLENQQK